MILTAVSASSPMYEMRWHSINHILLTRAGFSHSAGKDTYTLLETIKAIDVFVRVAFSPSLALTLPLPHWSADSLHNKMQILSPSLALSFADRHIHTRTFICGVLKIPTGTYFEHSSRQNSMTQYWRRVSDWILASFSEKIELAASTVYWQRQRWLQGETYTQASVDQCRNIISVRRTTVSHLSCTAARHVSFLVLNGRLADLSLLLMVQTDWQRTHARSHHARSSPSLSDGNGLSFVPLECRNRRKTARKENQPDTAWR